MKHGHSFNPVMLVIKYRHGLKFLDKKESRQTKEYSCTVNEKCYG
jgi:hypothetical protein